MSIILPLEYLRVGHIGRVLDEYAYNCFNGHQSYQETSISRIGRVRTSMGAQLV